MSSLIHSSPLLNCRTIEYLNSLLLLELGANLPRPSPGEVLSFWRFPVNYSDSDSEKEHDTASNQNQWIITASVICRFLQNTYMVSLFVPSMQAFFVKLKLNIGQVGMTSLQVNCSLAEVNASVFIAVF